MNLSNRFLLAIAPLGSIAALLVFTSAPGYGQSTPVVPINSESRVDLLGGAPRLGKSLALDGDNLVMGFGGSSPGGGGVIYHRDVSGAWIGEGITGTNSANSGASVAIDGDRVVVGSPYGEGQEYEFVSVMERVGTTWQNIGTFADGNSYHNFGISVDISGDTVIVGASHTVKGAIHIYHYDDPGWTEQLYAGPPNSVSQNSALSDLFGLDVAIDGDLAVTSSSVHADQHIALFQRTGSTWSFLQQITINDAGGLASLGYTDLGATLALDGDTLLALVTSADPTLDNGVCVFRDSGSGYVFEEVLFGSDTIKADRFGVKLDLDGNNAIIAAPSAQDGGVAYLFSRGVGGFVEDIKFVSTGDGPVGGPGFASDVAMSGTAVGFGSQHDISDPLTHGNCYVLTSFLSATSTQAFCSGNGTYAPNCANCPCGNNAPSSSIGGCLNSEGTSAILSMTGEARVSADTARMEVTRATPSSVALLVSGSVLLPLQLPAGCSRGAGVQSLAFNGLRCVGGVTRRHGVRATDSRGMAGDTNDGWGGPFAPAGGLVGQGAFVVGQNRYFQAIYRDAATSGCATGLNTTNAIAAMVLP